MQGFSKKLRSKGSITVEACLTLPVFLSVFFLLLFLVKFSCTSMILDNAVNETAKEIAASAYPISYLNELEDEKISEYGNAGIPTPEEELEKLAEGGLGSVGDIIVSEEGKSGDISSAIEGIFEDYKKGVIGEVIGRAGSAYWNMKAVTKYKIAERLIQRHLDNSLIVSENIKLSLVEFPQGKAEYEARSKSDVYEKAGLTPGLDFNSEDVVVQLEYDYCVKLPFVDALNVKMVHTAVEKAWVSGGYGILTAKEEGFDLDVDESMVFITRTGIRYHKGSCWHLRRSRLPIELQEAKAQGYTPCKVCKPQS